MKNTILSALVLSMSSALFAAPDANYDESKVPQYKLPDVLVSPKGEYKAKTATQWLHFVRPEVAEIFSEDLYGVIPPRPKSFSFKVKEQGDALDGTAIRRQVVVNLFDENGSHSFDLLMYYPKDSVQKKHPVFLGLNFKGNHGISFDKKVFLKDTWQRNCTLKESDESTRGANAGRWDLKSIIDNGFVVATIYYGDIYPDTPLPAAIGKSVFNIFDMAKFNPSRSSAIAAWSWGLSRAIDYLETCPEIDAEKIVLLGHSRLGKTSLYAGAFEKRAAIVISNNSGCMGSALSRRRFGETIKLMLDAMPHWQVPTAKQFCENENSLPVDQHQLMSLIAPRPLYITSASDDLWADPKGELMSLVEASKVYALFGAKDLPTMDNFKVEQPFHGDVAYHMRKGKHGVTDYDWKNFIEFAKNHFSTKNIKK